jgi:release factor glutamine methyltransferase
MTEKREAWTILAVLDWTRRHFEQKGIESARLDAELILASALKVPRVMLYARFDQPLQPEELARIRALVTRRARREPMAYLLGEREFWSLAFEVGPGVLIPRPDTETLVEAALAQVDRAAPLSVVDVGTGSGCIAVALARELPEARIAALDVSTEALKIAARNVTKHGLDARITLVQSDLLAALPASARPVDLVVANLPYIPSADLEALMPDVRDFEPRLALDGGPDGLALIRRLLPEAEDALTPGGAIALEAGASEVPAMEALLVERGWRDVKTHADAGGRLRVATARRPER